MVADNIIAHKLVTVIMTVIFEEQDNNYVFKIIYEGNIYMSLIKNLGHLLPCDFVTAKDFVSGCIIENIVQLTSNTIHVLMTDKKCKLRVQLKKID